MIYPPVLEPAADQIPVAVACRVLGFSAVGTVDSLGAATASSAVLTSAYGAGNLAVSLLLIVVPLRGRADRLVR